MTTSSKPPAYTASIYYIVLFVKIKFLAMKPMNEPLL